MKQRVLEEEQVTFSLLWYHYYSADLTIQSLMPLHQILFLNMINHIHLALRRSHSRLELHLITFWRLRPHYLVPICGCARSLAWPNYRQDLFSTMPQTIFLPIVGYPLPPAGHDVRAASDEFLKAL